MGWCYEFATEIVRGCGHAMAATESACSCPECGTVCRGRFSGCADVWARQTTSALLPTSSADPVALSGPKRRTRQSEGSAASNGTARAEPIASSNGLPAPGAADGLQSEVARLSQQMASQDAALRELAERRDESVVGGALVHGDLEALRRAVAGTTELVQHLSARMDRQDAALGELAGLRADSEAAAQRIERLVELVVRQGAALNELVEVRTADLDTIRRVTELVQSEMADVRAGGSAMADQVSYLADRMAHHDVALSALADVGAVSQETAERVGFLSEGLESLRQESLMAAPWSARPSMTGRGRSDVKGPAAGEEDQIPVRFHSPPSESGSTSGAK